MGTETGGAQALIEFRQVSKHYGEHSALKSVDLRIAKGEFVTVIGSSGSGKTTMLKMINGLLAPSEGTVRVFGEDVAKTDQIALRRKIGYVIQGIGLFSHLSVRKNIEFIPGILKFDKETSGAIARRLIKLVGLDEEMLDRYPSELSGGQQQRVGVARALAASPEILLMDEPFGALDEITRGMLQEELLKIHRELNITIFFITHDIREATKLGSRVLVMHEGEIVSSGPPAEILHGYDSGQHDFFCRPRKAADQAV
ncbi:ABC transporter ATP-binding protein [Deltaproteobacteria bacterium OttesenSCG-928-M10]|nr:ABC transporter ATP-binding protein [Deltaproteobacteria bacterium OttesenSCG-928-M10]